MWGVASVPFRCARCSCTPVWVRGSGPSRRCPYRVAVPPEGGGAPPALGGRRSAPVAPQLRWVRGGGGGAAPPPALGPVWEGGGEGGRTMDVCWGCVAETQRLCKTLGARAATGYGLVVQGDYGSDQKKARVGASECAPQGQLSVRKKHGYLTGLAWVRGARVAIQSLLSYPGWVVWECVP